jgi:hypothetical protein
VYSGPVASLPASVDSMQGSDKEQSLCRWQPHASAISLAARMSSRLYQRKSTRTVTLLAVQAAGAYEEGGGSFRARRHTRLLRCAAIPSAPPHAVPPSASAQWEEHIVGVSAPVASP